MIELYRDNLLSSIACDMGTRTYQSRVAQNLPSTRYTNFPHGMKFYGSSIVEKYKKEYSRA